jgi:hypothetical protein
MIMHHFTRSIVVLLSAGLLTAAASAAPIAYEGFAYNAGTQVGTTGALNGGSGWSDAWSASDANAQQFQVASNGLSYSDTQGNVLVTGGRALQSFDATSVPRITRDADTSSIGTGTLWMSFLVRFVSTTEPTASPGTPDRFGFSFELLDGANGRFSIEKPSPNVSGQAPTSTISMSNRGGTATANSSTLLTGTTMFLARVTFDASGANERADLWINPRLDGEGNLGTPQIENLVSTGNWSWTGPVRLSAIRSVWEFDEIRFGTTYAQVTPYIPEPASLGLLGLAGLMLGRRRR